jgi:hypothetical protein
MSTNITDLAFSESSTLSVILRTAVDGNTHLDGDTVLDIQELGVMVDYSSTRYFVPWSNILAVKS